jgi:hypothetical protein
MAVWNCSDQIRKIFTVFSALALDAAKGAAGSQDDSEDAVRAARLISGFSRWSLFGVLVRVAASLTDNACALRPSQEMPEAKRASTSSVGSSSGSSRCVQSSASAGFGGALRCILAASAMCQHDALFCVLCSACSHT